MSDLAKIGDFILNSPMPQKLNLAKMVRRLNLSKDVLEIIQGLNEVYKELERHYRKEFQTDAQLNRLICEHPLTQLLAYRLKTIACSSPDISYRRCEMLVESMCEDFDESETRIQTSNRQAQVAAASKPGRASKYLSDFKGGKSGG